MVDVFGRKASVRFSRFASYPVFPCHLRQPSTALQVLNPGRPPLAAPQGRWPAAWSLVRSILRVGRGGERSNGAHSSAAEESSEEELQMRLCELHSTIYLQVHGVAGTSWAAVEAMQACAAC